MSDGQVPDYSEVPPSVVKRWVRPREYARGVTIAELAGYWLLACGVEAIFRFTAHRQMGSLGARTIAGATYLVGGLLVAAWWARHSSRQRSDELSPSVVDLRDRVLSRIGRDQAPAYPTNFAALIALIILAGGFALTGIASLWLGLPLWPLAVGSGTTAAIALIVFLVSRRQYRRDLQWALNYEEPPLP
jgi:hypothetical protein